MRIDVVGGRDLNLNTARNLVIYDEKWSEFVNDLSNLICKEVRAQVSAEYWTQLLNVWSLLASGNREAEVFLQNARKI
jgi:hypothetical protein